MYFPIKKQLFSIHFNNVVFEYLNISSIPKILHKLAMVKFVNTSTKTYNKIQTNELVLLAVNDREPYFIWHKMGEVKRWYICHKTISQIFTNVTWLLISLHLVLWTQETYNLDSFGEVMRRGNPTDSAAGWLWVTLVMVYSENICWGKTNDICWSQT